MRDADYFLELQTETGWGRVLARFVTWVAPRPGWLALDLGCGPGLLPALLARQGCQAVGSELDPAMFQPQPLHSQVLVADIYAPPFSAASFDLLTASNLLFLLPDPSLALVVLAGLLRPDGQLCLLNPSELLTQQAALQLVEQRQLQGLARQTLLNWAARAEVHFRWTEAQLAGLLAAAGLELLETELQVGPGFARFARASLKA